MSWSWRSKCPTWEPTWKSEPCPHPAREPPESPIDPFLPKQIHCWNLLMLGHGGVGAQDIARRNQWCSSAVEHRLTCQAPQRYAVIGLWTPRPVLEFRHWDRLPELALQDQPKPTARPAHWPTEQELTGAPNINQILTRPALPGK